MRRPQPNLPNNPVSTKTWKVLPVSKAGEVEDWIIHFSEYLKQGPSQTFFRDWTQNAISMSAPNPSSPPVWKQCVSHHIPRIVLACSAPCTLSMWGWLYFPGINQDIDFPLAFPYDDQMNNTPGTLTHIGFCADKSPCRFKLHIWYKVGPTSLWVSLIDAQDN